MLWRRKWQPTPVFLPGESHGQRSLAGYSAWCRKESDTWQLNNNNNKYFIFRYNALALNRLQYNVNVTVICNGNQTKTSCELLYTIHFTEVVWNHFQYLWGMPKLIWKSSGWNFYYHCTPTRLPLWLSWQRICLQCGRPEFDPRVRKIPWRRKWQPTPVLLPGEFYGQRSGTDCSPRITVGHDCATFFHTPPLLNSLCSVSFHLSKYSKSIFRFQLFCLYELTQKKLQCA